jgi:NitT/TauT family transport system substrate-binding protein
VPSIKNSIKTIKLKFIINSKKIERKGCISMKKVISMILILSFMVFVFSGCASNVNKTDGETSAGTEKMKIKVAAPQGAPTLSMIKMFKDNPDFGENFELSYESVKSPDLMSSRIISGEIDIAVVSTNLAATLYNKGVDYKLAASSVWGALYIVGNEKTEDLEELRGKEIYTMGRGLTPDIVLRYILSGNGIDPEKDVTLTYVGEGTELASAFISGKCALAVIPEPILSNVMLKKQNTLILFDLQKEWIELNKGNFGYPQASLIIKNDIIEKNPQFVELFLKEYEKSINWLSENVQTAGEYSEELETGISKDAVVNGFERSNIKFVNSKDAKESVDDYLKILYEYSPEVIGGKLPDEDFYLEK